MNFLLLTFVALFGAILGSFLNALSFRFNTGRSIVHGRSRCMQCGHTLTALDLIPVVSYIFLWGRCRYCHAHVSLQYPIVEVLAAVLSVGIFLVYPAPVIYLFWLVVWMIILFIVIYDLRHTIIPWSCSIFLMFLGFLSLFVSGTPTMLMLIAGPCLALPLFLLSFLSRGRWMGWGDSGFELSLGWLLGLGQGATALTLAVWTGAAIGLLLMLVSQLSWKLRAHRFTMSSEIPFAPFLALGAALVYFFHVDFFTTFSTLW